MIYVYIAVSESRKLIKIGRTSDYKQRRTMLRGELKAPDLAYAVLIESDEFAMNHDEWQLHLKFAPHFLNGNTREQFVLCEETRRAIYEIAALAGKDGILAASSKVFLWSAVDGEKQHIGKPMKPPKGERFSRKPKQTGFHTLRIKLPDQLHARLRRMASDEEYAAQDRFTTSGTMQSLALRALTRLAGEGDAAKINPALASANPQKRGL